LQPAALQILATAPLRLWFAALQAIKNHSASLPQHVFQRFLGRVINCLPCALPSKGDGCAKRGAAHGGAMGKPCDKADTSLEGSALEAGN